jgi:hypothetical protein
MTRLEKIVGKDTFEYIFAIYKDAKQRHDLYKLLTVKSFVTKMIEAQNETAIYDGKCHKVHVSVSKYLEIIQNGVRVRKSETPLGYIMFLCEIVHPFGYKKEKDFGKLL